MNEWQKNTGTMPVPKGTMVDVRYRDDEIQLCVPAGLQTDDTVSWAEDWTLEPYYCSGDIIEWRYAK